MERLYAIKSSCVAMGGGRADLRTLVERTKCSRTGNSLSRVETKEQTRSAEGWLRSVRGKERRVRHQPCRSKNHGRSTYWADAGVGNTQCSMSCVRGGEAHSLSGVCVLKSEVEAASWLCHLLAVEPRTNNFAVILCKGGTGLTLEYHVT